MHKFEKHLDCLKQYQNAESVENALKNVRILAGRPKLIAPIVLLASLEVLIHRVVKAGLSDTEYYSRALQACRQFEDKPACVIFA